MSPPRLRGRGAIQEFTTCKTRLCLKQTGVFAPSKVQHLSKALKEMCVLEAHDLIKTKTKVIDGKPKTYQERTPLATYAIATAEPDPEP